MKLTKKQLADIQAILAPKGTKYQASRVCDLLAQGEFRTAIVASSCSIGNISDCVNNVINPQIAHLGLWIGCVRPPNVIRNKFGQKAGDYLWSFRVIPNGAAANDADYGSTTDDWEEKLKGLDLEPDKPRPDNGEGKEA